MGLLEGINFKSWRPNHYLHTFSVVCKYQLRADEYYRVFSVLLLSYLNELMVGWFTIWIVGHSISFFIPLLSLHIELIPIPVYSNSDNPALHIDAYHGMIPLHMSMSVMTPMRQPIPSLPYLLYKKEALMSLDCECRPPLDYAREYNVGGMIKLIRVLCKEAELEMNRLELTRRK